MSDKIIGGDFRVIKTFSKGAMGDVFLVEKETIPFPLILKSCKAVKPDLKDLFIKEVFNWTSFGVHQNIVKCHFAEEIEGVLFVAAEYVEGTNGRNTISDFLDERIPLYLLIKWGIQFCFGMNHCAKKGMIAHGDIKPDNLLVDLDSNLKISDFGLSKSYLNQEKTGGGTPLYYSPEQIIDSTKIDHRSDIYSFGIVLYQLVSGGVSPYNFTTYEELINAHFKQPIKKLNHPLFHIISKCLRKSPDERYQQYRLLFKAIVEVAQENDITIPKQIETRDDKLEELYLLSTSLSAIGHKDDALKAINQYLTYQPDHSSAWTQKGRLEYEIGNIEVALNATKKSIALYPYSSQATNNLGAIYTKIEDWENAKTCLLKSVELSPNNSGALMNLGMVLLRTQNNNEV